MKKTRRNIYLLLLRTSVWKEVRHFSVQCILTETTWLPTLLTEKIFFYEKQKTKDLMLEMKWLNFDNGHTFYCIFIQMFVSSLTD